MPLSLDPERRTKTCFPWRIFSPRSRRRSWCAFSTAGSVDDGKSTLIGRLLYDSQNVYEDHVRAVTKAATANVAAAIDFAQLTDGLRAEREQGITIDVAYRYFSTTHRKFIIADTPGHEQYTRNMATGASTADVAIILVDARKGILTQSRRHAYIASLLGHPPHRRRRQQDGPGGLLARGLSPARSAILQQLAAQAAHRRSAGDPHQRLARRQCRRPRHKHGLVRGPNAARVSGDRAPRAGCNRRVPSACLSSE